MKTQTAGIAVIALGVIFYLAIGKLINGSKFLHS